MSKNATDSFIAIGNNLSITPRCRYCRKYLASTDKQKTTGIYWKSCQKCRDKRAAKERKRKGPYVSADVAVSFSTSKKKRTHCEKVREKPFNFCKRAKEEAVGSAHLVPPLELVFILQIDNSVCPQCNLLLNHNSGYSRRDGAFEQELCLDTKKVKIKLRSIIP